MERRGFDIPLLIGGATTSVKHTAVKIAPAYDHPTLHVNDASRCPGVVERLMNPASRDAIAAENAEAQAVARARHAAEGAARPLLSSDEAAVLAAPFGEHVPEPPAFTGVVPLELSVPGLVPYVDWTPFFNTWEIRGTADSLLSGDVDPRVAELKREVSARSSGDGATVGRLLGEVKQRAAVRVVTAVVHSWKHARVARTLCLWQAGCAADAERQRYEQAGAVQLREVRFASSKELKEAQAAEPRRPKLDRHISVIDQILTNASPPRPLRPFGN